MSLGTSLKILFWTHLFLSLTSERQTCPPSTWALAWPALGTLLGLRRNQGTCFFVSREFRVERPIVPQYKAASLFFFKILNWEKQTRTYRGKRMSQEGGKLYSLSSGTLSKLLAFCSLYEEIDKPDNLCSLPSLISNNC